jgi:hypothetical protein
MANSTEAVVQRSHWFVIHITLGSAAAQEFSHKLIQYPVILTVKIRGAL